MKFIYGSHNENKIKQVQEFFESKGIKLEILSLKEIGFQEEIIENGKTFEENSKIKAEAIQKYCQNNRIEEIIVTDDAGICVDALGGKPGVYSARYAGEQATQEETLEKLLTNLKEVEEEKRTASFVCVLTAILKNGESMVVRGETKGKIAKTPGKMGGLTYAPVFIPNGFNKVMSEFEPQELETTHREKAFLELMEKLAE